MIPGFRYCVLIILFKHLEFSGAQAPLDCAADARVGHSGIGKKNTIPHSSDTSVIMMDEGRGENNVPPEVHPQFKPMVECCGRVIVWEIDYRTGGGPLSPQLWRPLGGDKYSLIGEGYRDAPNGGVYNVTPLGLVYSHPGDRIGFTGDAIEWGEKHGYHAIYCGWVLAEAGLNPSPGDTYTLATEHAKTNDNDQNHPTMLGFGIALYLEQRDDPECTIYFTPDTITESTPIGTVIGRVTTSRKVDNSIPGYNLTFVSTGGLGSVILNSSTGEITTTANLTVSKPPESDIYKVVAETKEMLCFKAGTCSATLTLEFVNHPLEMYAKPVNYTLIESTTKVTQIAVVYTTDMNRNSNLDLIPKCALIGSFPALAPFNLTRDAIKTQFNLAYDGITRLQYDFVNAYRLEILCTDDYYYSASITYTVSIGQNYPPDVANTISPTTKKIHFTADARLIKKGNPVVTLLITDKESDYINTTYDALGIFSPFEWNGVNFTVLATKDLFDLEDTQTDFDFRIEVWDEWNRPKRYSLALHIVGVNSAPLFTNCPQTIQLREDRTAGFEVFKAGTIDDNFVRDNQKHTFSMTVSPTTFTTTFKLNAADGNITLSGTGNGINYESAAVGSLKGNSIKFDISVNDGIHNAKKNCEVDVNIIDVNERPTLVQNTFTVNMNEEEDWPKVITEVKLEVRDEDIIDTNRHKFELLSSSNPGEYFDIGISTGVLKLVKRCDTESACPSKFTLLIHVEDVRGLETTATVTVNINDINDNKPTFNTNTQTITISPDTTTAQVLTTVTATDADPGINGIFSYQVVGRGYGSSLFTVSQNGELRLKNRHPFRETTEFTITIAAKDKGTPPQIGYTNIDVTWLFDPAIIATEEPQREDPCLTCTGAGVAIVTAITVATCVLIAFIGWQIYRFCGDDIQYTLSIDRKPFSMDDWRASSSNDKVFHTRVRHFHQKELPPSGVYEN